MTGDFVGPRIARRRSRLHGWGIFALEPISRDTRIIDFAGETIDDIKTILGPSRG
jgi:SET domain-containing protein